MNRIWVVGSSGAGKSTLALRLSDRLGLRYTELDGLYWCPGWQPAPLDEFRAAVDVATSGPRWVVCGNYSKAQTCILARVDTVIWLDYPLPLILRRLVWRTIQRVWSRDNLWGSGNTESWRNAFLSRDSLILYMLQTHRARRQRYMALMAAPDLASVTWLRFRSARATDAWLAGLAAS